MATKSAAAIKDEVRVRDCVVCMREEECDLY